jgi:ZIP family zinc transporter
MENFWIALGLTALAGLSTGVGSAIAFFAHRANYRFLSVATGFSAGVMLYVSFTEILGKTNEGMLAAFDSEATAAWATAASFFGGIVLMLLIDRLIPSAENPHEVRKEKQVEALHPHGPAPISARGGVAPDAAQAPDQATEGHEEPGAHHQRKLMRMGLFTALAIGIHNFPEGFATFLSAIKDPSLGLAIAIAIALHNIPEGISVSVPIYYATGKRRKAFAWSMVSGLAEPVGALVGYLALRSFMNDFVMAVSFGAVAGIMVYISLDELLPTSRAYGKGHESLYGLLAGMVVMALSLLLLV